VLATLWFKEEMINKIVLGARSGWKSFHFNMINGADK
jgi:hypothetical protein